MSAPAPAPASPPRPANRYMETMLRRLLLPGTLTRSTPQSSPVPACRDWTNIDIPLHVAVMVGGKGGLSVFDDFATGGRRTSPAGKRQLIRGGGSAARISNKLLPPDPGGGGLSTIARMRTPEWTLPPTGPRDCLWTPDEHTYPPLSREPVEQLVFIPGSRRLTYRTDKQRGGEVKASALAINVIPSRRQRTLKDELCTNEVIVFGPAGDVAVGVASSADLAGDVTVGVTSLADLAGDVIIGVTSSDDLAGDVTVGVTSSADLAGDITVGVASSADLAGVVAVGAASSAELAGDATVSVASSANHAGDVTVGVTSSALLESSPSVRHTQPILLEMSPSLWRLQPIWIVFSSPVRHLWKNVRNVMCCLVMSGSPDRSGRVSC